MARSTRKLDKLPDGWRCVDGATTAPVGWLWANNGESRFGGSYESALVKEGNCGEGQEHRQEARQDDQEDGRMRLQERGQEGASGAAMLEEERHQGRQGEKGLARHGRPKRRGERVTLEYGPGEAYAVQTLARHQAIKRLLQDVRFDMQVCLIEGWDVREYPRMISEAVRGLS